LESCRPIRANDEMFISNFAYFKAIAAADRLPTNATLPVT
jgi:hypothetical protein